LKPKPDDSPKPFRVQRRRLGEIKFMRPEGDFGFIDAEDFREDVFFHKSAWQGETNGRHRDPQEGLYVEFEIDEDYREKEKKLRASVVRLTTRPMGRKLTGRDTPHLVNKHHPRARQKRPSWRGTDLPPAPPLGPENPPAE
jgi:cold shock CspA family protein